METLPQTTGQSCDWYDLPCHLTSFAGWLFDVLLFIPKKLYEGVIWLLKEKPALLKPL